MNKLIIKRIMELKKEKNAIILAHYYQPNEIQNIADYIGDSYYLSQIARDCKEEVIVLCGVKFMAESAKILSPNKTVLLPNLASGCSMADMATDEAIINLKDKHKEATVVCYINSTATVKTHCDVAVTSSSAIDIIKNIDNNKIIFLPDYNLGEYIAEKFPEKEFILWDGFCKYHNNITKDQIVELKGKYKDALILVHPECNKSVRDMADYIGSTAGIINYVNNSDNDEFIIGTEDGILNELKKNNPNKNFYIPGDSICCMYMKLVTLEDIYNVLTTMKNKVELDKEILSKAKVCLNNMHRLSEK